MARKPPRITSTRRQRTTRGGPVVTSRTPQPITPSYTRGGATGEQWIAAARRGAAAKPGGGSPGAPAAPTAPAAPQYSLASLPPDASYDQAIALLQRQRAENITALVGERTRGLSDYGFQEGPNGTLTFDPNNPFSKAALLKKAYDTNRRSTANSMAAGGQLYSGARQNALDLVSRNQLQAQDAQQKTLQAFLASNTRRRGQAQTDYETAAGQAYGDRVGRFQSNPLYDPAAGQPAPTQPQVAAAAAATPAVSKARRPRRPKGVGNSAWSGWYRN